LYHPAFPLLLTGVGNAAQRILAEPSIPPLDILMNNADIMACPYKEAEDGFAMLVGLIEKLLLSVLARHSSAA
jgi:hypothetical protein